MVTDQKFFKVFSTRSLVDLIDYNEQKYKCTVDVLSCKCLENVTCTFSQLFENYDLFQIYSSKLAWSYSIF